MTVIVIRQRFSSRAGAHASQLVIQTSSGPARTPMGIATNRPATLPTATSTPQPPFSDPNFVYDGDGKRVKSILNGTITTYFVGAHYEVKGSTVTKYYYAGAQRIAMRTNGTLNYLLGDHLGSTSLTTNASGQVVSELRYKAWGEVRYASGNMQTKYQYTGQYTYTGDFGLMFYNARWYDPYLNHFTQPDTIVPDPYNSQAWDRYAFVNNNPLKYIDRDGHFPILIFLALIGATVFLSQIPSDQYQTNPADWGNPGVQFVGASLMFPQLIVGNCINDGDCTNEAQAINQVAQNIGDPSDEVNTVSNITSADLPAIEKFAEETGITNPARGYKSFGSTWNLVAQTVDQTRVFVNRLGGKITGMMQVGEYRGGGYEIKMLEGLGNGAGTSLFKQAISDSIAKGYGGSIYLNPAKQALQWYLKNFPGAVQLENGYLYWSKEAAKAILKQK